MERTGRWVSFKSNFKRSKYLLFMTVPMIVYYIIFRYMPIFGLVISFQDFRPLAGQSVIRSILNSEYLGLQHFVDFFGSLYGKQILLNTFLISLYKIVFGFPAPIILALMLNEVKKERLKSLFNLSAIFHILYHGSFLQVLSDLFFLRTMESLFRYSVHSENPSLIFLGIMHTSARFLL